MYYTAALLILIGSSIFIFDPDTLWRPDICMEPVSCLIGCGGRVKMELCLMYNQIGATSYEPLNG